MAQRVAWRTMLDVLTSVVLLSVSGLIGWRLLSAPAQAIPSITDPASIDTAIGATVNVRDAAVLGLASAPIAIVEYSDFQCPFCGKFSMEVLPKLDAAYLSTGKVAFYFKHFPLNIHPLAERAAVFAECTRPSGNFWRFSESLFTTGRELSQQVLDQAVVAHGVSSVSSCLDESAPLKRVQADREEALRLGLKSTPSFLIGKLETGGVVRVVKAIRGGARLAVLESAMREVGNDQKGGGE